jgi:hypothetical protein
MGQANRDPITSPFRRGRQLIRVMRRAPPTTQCRGRPSTVGPPAHNEKAPPKRGYDRRSNTGGSGVGLRSPPIFLQGGLGA